MLVEVARFMAETFEQIWRFLYNGGIIGMSIILIPILRKLVSIVKQFTN